MSEPKVAWYAPGRVESEADVERLYPIREGWRDTFDTDPITTMGRLWPDRIHVTRSRTRSGESVRISATMYVPAETET